MSVRASFDGLPTDFVAPTAETVDYTGGYGSPTTSSDSSVFTGRDDYSFWPNAVYISKFYHSPSTEANLTQLDRDLYNYCYLPYSFTNGKRELSDTRLPRPTYQADEPPCKREAAINANCFWENTNHTFSGLLTPESAEALEAQRSCYCNIYPYFDSKLGCQECFHQHGGIGGYHWFPKEYIVAFQSLYCGQKTITTDFLASAQAWSRTQTDIKVPTTTAPNVLGTATDASLYYTYDLAQTGAFRSTSFATTLPTGNKGLLLAGLFLLSISKSVLSGC